MTEVDTPRIASEPVIAAGAVLELMVNDLLVDKPANVEPFMLDWLQKWHLRSLTPACAENKHSQTHKGSVPHSDDCVEQLRQRRDELLQRRDLLRSRLRESAVAASWSPRSQHPKKSREIAGSCHLDSASQSLDRDAASLGSKVLPTSASKKMSSFAGVAVLINYLCGPALVLMPALAQQAGWLVFIALLAFAGLLAVACSCMLAASIQLLPGCKDSSRMATFTDLVNCLLPYPLAHLVVLCYHIYLLLLLLSHILQSSQVLDDFMLGTYGYTPGIALMLDWGATRGRIRLAEVTTATNSLQANSVVLPCSIAMVGVVCAPWLRRNLIDNVVLQGVLVVGLCCMVLAWIRLLVLEPSFPTPLPSSTGTRPGLLTSSLLFDFAISSVVPTWVQAKHPDVSASRSFGFSVAFVILVYAAVGITGGLALRSGEASLADGDFLGKLISSESRLGWVSVIIYPVLRNFSAIPVILTTLRHSICHTGLLHAATICFIASMAWVFHSLYPREEGFSALLQSGGFVASAVVNFLVPIVVYLVAKQRQQQKKEK